MKAHSASSFALQGSPYVLLSREDQLELAATLRELIDIYQDEIRGGVPCALHTQPECILRAHRALRKLEILAGAP
jgi:hypothetical protein